MIKKFNLFENIEDEYSYNFYPQRLMRVMSRIEYIEHMRKLLIGKRIIFYQPIYNGADKYDKYEGIVKELYNNNTNYTMKIVLDEPKVLDYFLSGTPIYNERKYVIEPNLRITVFSKRPVVSTEDPLGEEVWDD